MSRTRVDRTTAAQPKPRPNWLRALGADSPPETLEIDGRPHFLLEVFKHDSWAATSLYGDGNGLRRVVKLHRRSSAFGLPLRWIGLLTAYRERTLLHKLADLSGIPKAAGPVTIGGEVQPNGVARDFLDGHPLGDRERVDDAFFPALKALLVEMHGRRVAYVDLHKRENVLVDEQGAPVLFDFQISANWPAWLPTWPVFSILSRSDDYHLMKHWTRCRPDQAPLSSEEFESHRPWYIRAHRKVAMPVRELRRKLLVKLGVRTGKGRVDSEQFAEHALRSDEKIATMEGRAA